MALVEAAKTSDEARARRGAAVQERLPDFEEASEALHELTRECLERSDKNWDRAKADLRQIISDSPEYRRMMLAFALRKGIDWLVDNAVGHGERKASWGRVDRVESTGESSNVVQYDRILTAATGKLSDFTLPYSRGLCLSDAKADDIQPVAERLFALGNNTLHKARWLRKIAETLPKGKRVRDVLAEEDLKRLQKETENA